MVLFQNRRVNVRIEDTDLETATDLMKTGVRGIGGKGDSMAPATVNDCLFRVVEVRSEIKTIQAGVGI